MRGICRFAAWAAFAVVVAVGCGTGDYDERVQAVLSEARAEEPFLRLWPEETELFGGSATEGPLTLRVPRLFSKHNSYAFDASSPEPRDVTKPLDPHRVQPSFLTLPGHLRTYERIFEFVERKRPGQGGDQTYRWPVYFSIAKIDVEQAGDGKAFRKKLKSQLVDEFGTRRAAKSKDRSKRKSIGVQADWEFVSVPSGSGLGGQARWHRLAATGDQSFHIYGTGDEKAVATPVGIVGQVFVYHRVLPRDEQAATADSDQHVVLVLRAPLSLARREQLASLGKAIAGTVEIDVQRATDDE